MKVILDIDNADDAANAAAMCLALGDAFELYENPEKLREKLDEADKLRERQNAIAVEKPIAPGKSLESLPGDTLEEKLGTTVATAVKEERRRRKKQPAPAPAPVPEQESASDSDPREQLVTMARERGIVWARAILGKYNAKKFADLLDDEVAEILAA